MAQQASTQPNNKWKTAQGTGNVYTPWDSNIIVRDATNEMVQLNKKLKKEHDYEEKIGPNWYRVRDSNGSWLIYAENEQKHQEQAQRGTTGGKKADEWWNIVDMKTVETLEQLQYAIQQERWKVFGKSFREATQVVNGKLVYGLVKREKGQQGGSSADAGPQEAAPPV